MSCANIVIPKAKNSEKKKNSLPPFMTDEIENLQMEINSYRRQLQQIEKGVSQ